MKTMMLKCSIFLVNLFALCYSDGVFDVTNFGADLSAKNKSTDAIKKAIDAAASSGGGVVYFPKGLYLTGPIHLESNITLELEEGAEISFSSDFNDYLPMVIQRWEGTVVNNFSPLIYAYQKQNITIKGQGVLEGNGKVWWDKWKELNAIYTENQTRPEPYQEEFVKNNNLTELAEVTLDMARINVGFLRSVFIQPYESKNILIEGVTIRNSPFWNVNPIFSENITVRNIRIEAPADIGKNTDGINPDSCKDVHITGVVIDTGDDCIAIKSGRDLQGRNYGVPSENILIENSLMLRGHSGVAIGSEASAGVHNVTIRNCVFNGSDKGVAIKTARGRGGVIEHIHAINITMTNILKEAIKVTMGYAGEDIPEPFSDRTPVIQNLEYKNITGDAVTAVDLSGIEESLLTNITITDVSLKSQTKPGVNAQFIRSLQLTTFSQELED